MNLRAGTSKLVIHHCEMVSHRLGAQIVLWTGPVEIDGVIAYAPSGSMALVINGPTGTVRNILATTDTPVNVGETVALSIIGPGTERLYVSNFYAEARGAAPGGAATVGLGLQGGGIYVADGVAVAQYGYGIRRSLVGTDCWIRNVVAEGQSASIASVDTTTVPYKLLAWPNALLYSSGLAGPVLGPITPVAGTRVGSNTQY